MCKKIIYIDMDNTLADYLKAAKECNIEPDSAKHVPNFFRNLKPMPGAIEAYNLLSKYFDVYILTTQPWSNPMSCVEKIEWVNEWLPNAKKRVIFNHNKQLNKGDYLIDDSLFNGVDKFEGEHIQIYSNKFTDWDSVIQYIFTKENIKL